MNLKVRLKSTVLLLFDVNISIDNDNLYQLFVKCPSHPIIVEQLSSCKTKSFQMKKVFTARKSRQRNVK
jgi:hypothetical protein